MAAIIRTVMPSLSFVERWKSLGSFGYLFGNSFFSRIRYHRNNLFLVTHFQKKINKFNMAVPCSVHECCANARESATSSPSYIYCNVLASFRVWILYVRNLFEQSFDSGKVSICIETVSVQVSSGMTGSKFHLLPLFAGVRTDSRVQ